MLCWSLFVLLYFFFWPLCCLFISDIRILIAPFDIFNLFLYIKLISCFIVILPIFFEDMLWTLWTECDYYINKRLIKIVHQRYCIPNDLLSSWCDWCIYVLKDRRNTFLWKTIDHLYFVIKLYLIRQCHLCVAGDCRIITVFDVACTYWVHAVSVKQKPV